MSRFLITPVVKGDGADGSGRVAFRIYEKAGGCVIGCRSVATDVRGPAGEVVTVCRDEIIRLIRVLYRIIERRSDSGCCCGVDEVVAEFRSVLRGEVAVAGSVDGDFALRADLVSLGNGFKGDFRMAYALEDVSYGMLGEYIVSLVQVARNEGKESRVRSYSSLRRSLSRFLDGGDVRFDALDRGFVSDYGAWLRGEGVSESTQSFYLRTLRAVLNLARTDGLYIGDDNLFAGMNTRVLFPGVSGVPATLSRELMWKISGVDLEDDVLRVVRDMFMFAFHCKGMELTDVLNLRQEDVREGILSYRRRGTGSLKSMILDANAKEIAGRYGSGDDGYLFPLRGMFPGRQQYSLNGVVRRSLRRIGEMVGVPELSFGMNISTWRGLLSGVDAGEILRGSA